MDEAALKALFAEFLAAMKPMIEEIIKGALKVEVDAIGDAAMPANIAMPAEDMVEMKAKADAEKARADAAEAKLGAIEARDRKARGAVLTTALAARGIKVSGYDLARADAADITAAESALLDHALASQPRADQWGEPIPTPAAPAAPTLYKI